MKSKRNSNYFFTFNEIGRCVWFLVKESMIKKIDSYKLFFINKS